MSHGEPWGSGLKLTRHWDLEIDETGDLETVAGMDELEKDLALRTAMELDDYHGGVMGKNTLADVRITVRDILNADERVNRVVNVNVEQIESREDEIRIRATVVSNDDQTYDLIEEFDI